MLRDVVIPRLDEFCFNMGYSWEYLHKAAPTDVIVKAHGYSYVLYLRSAENYLRWEGMQGTMDYPLIGGWIDEGASVNYPEMWDYFTRRITRFNTDAIRFVTSTPPVPGLKTYSGGDNYWIYKKIDNIHEGTTMENVFLPDAKGYARQIENEVGETLARALVYGEKVISTSGKLFWGYNPEAHVVDHLPFNPNYLQHLQISFDFNVNPMTALLFTIDQGVLYIYESFRQYGSGSRKLTRHIIDQWITKRCKDLHSISIYGDPAGYWASSSSEVDKMDTSLSNYDIIWDQLYYGLNKRVHKDNISIEATRRAPTVAGSADVVNIMFEKGLIRLYSGMEYFDDVDQDITEDPMDKNKEREQWKKKYPERSHYGDQLRYIVNAIFGDIRSFDYEYRQQFYNR